MDLQVVEKYPGSRRLDHPNFGSVLKTDFKKAKITEVKKLQDDPMKMDALVKVEGVGDYLPLFFHPKKEYWDSPEGVKAQDFDPEQKLHKMAWMSFRPDDEVAVMYQEGEPIGVIAFADGVPRIGENIIMVDLTTFNFEEHMVPQLGYETPWDVSIPSEKHSIFINCVQQKVESVIDVEPTPDGIPLGLVQEATLLLYRDEKRWAFFPWGNWAASSQAYLIFYMADWAIPVGSLLYVIQITGRGNWERMFAIPGVPYGEEWGWSRVVDYIWVSALPYSKKALDDLKAAAAASSLSPFDVSNASLTQFPDDPKKWGIDYPGALKQTDLIKSLRNTQGIDQMYSMDPILTKFMVRPHTKEELQAAGMWPAPQGG